MTANWEHKKRFPELISMINDLRWLFVDQYRCRFTLHISRLANKRRNDFVLIGALEKLLLSISYDSCQKTMVLIYHRIEQKNILFPEMSNNNSTLIIIQLYFHNSEAFCNKKCFGYVEQQFKFVQNKSVAYFQWTLYFECIRTLCINVQQ